MVWLIDEEVPLLLVTEELVTVLRLADELFDVLEGGWLTGGT